MSRQRLHEAIEELEAAVEVVYADPLVAAVGPKVTVFVEPVVPF